MAANSEGYAVRDTAVPSHSSQPDGRAAEPPHQIVIDPLKTLAWDSRTAMQINSHH